MKKSTSAFTIVELLIVIVVIAILATIGIVAYTGIQQRAKNAQVVGGVNTYYKAILQYGTLNGAYPSVNNACLGADYPGGQCWNGPNGTHSVNASVDSQLATVMSSKPALAAELFPVNAVDQRAGAIWITSGGQRRIVYYLQGTGQSCGISGAAGTNEGGLVTQCSLVFPAL